MRVNWRKFLFTFSLMYAILLVATLASGCSAAWLGAVSALLPALEAAVTAAVAFVAALEGKTVSASVTAAIQKIGADIAGEITNVQQLIASYQANASTGTLSQIQAVFQSIVVNLGSILTNAQITDSATTSKLTQLVGLAVAAAQAILGFIPLVSAKLSQPGVTREELEADDKVATQHVKQVEEGLKTAYQAFVTEKTGQVDVDAALAKLPQSL